MPISPGESLGPYEIISTIGAGGMGEVYKARDTRLARTVAIKVSKQEFSERFEREARAVAALNHSRICSLYDIGPNYLVFEYVDGEPLKGPLPLEKALDYAAQICDALDAAHTKGITHRDLKPANILVTKQGVKLLDFGLAKIDNPIEGAEESLTRGLTMQGQIVGTLLYMSPEQLQGKDADARSDLFSFGCVLYEMLTGKHAFDGASSASVIAAILERPAPSIADIAPPALDRVLKRCLEKDPDNRWQSARDLKAAFGLLFDAPSAVAPTPASPAHERRWLKPAFVAFAMGVGLAALLGFAIRQWGAAPPPATVARFAIPIPEVQQTNFIARNIAISPDGTQIVYEANRRLYLRPISESEAKPIAGTEDSVAATSPTFSPNGKSIAFYAAGDRTLRSIPVIGGAASVLAHVDQLGVYGMSWTREGIVFGQGLKSIVEVPEKGGEPKVLATASGSEYFGYPELLPGVNMILFSTADPSRNSTRLVAQSKTSGERKILIAEENNTGAFIAAHYLETGHLVYVTGGNLFAVRFDLQKLEAIGTPVTMIQGVRQSGLVEPMFSISAAGSLIYMPGPIASFGGSLNLAVSDRNGKLERLNVPQRNYQTPRLSPDGKRIAFGIEDGSEANIWIYNLSGATAISRLTVGGKNKFPVWSPDGQRIAFQSDRDGDLAIFLQRSDGSSLAERLTKPEKGVSHAPESWSPNGATLLFRAMRDSSNASLWAFSIQERQSMPFGKVQSNGPTNAVFSPDGRWVAYHALEPGKNLHEVFVQPFPATGALYQLPISRDNHHPVWSRDGKELLYLPGPGEYAAVSFTAIPSVAFGNPVPFRGAVNTAPPNTPRQYDITADGKIIGRFSAEQTQADTPATPQISIVLNWFEELKQRVPVR
jgi:Tol biopolymer transport system component/predicted Ser/Thr protein kinase